MRDTIEGTFHFHSTYSHDGRSTLDSIASTLRSRGFSFCIMTEHFEDFDRQKFDRYIEDINRLNRREGFVLVPGVEVNLSGIDTIVFPAWDYTATARFAVEGEDQERRLFKVIAHPSKYQFEALTRHLDKYEIDGIELWNQQADSRYIPPIALLESLRAQSWRHDYRYLFGCDLHDVSLAVANVISLRRPPQLTASYIVDELTNGSFLTRNMTTGIVYSNGPQSSDFDQWAETVLERPYYIGTLLGGLRRCLKRTYRLLPRDTKHSLNDFKNFVRNKI